jgi:predicted DNA-binding transcriptional regulator YafY
VSGSRANIAAVRADRLVAVLLLLQTKGQVTAAEVAAELEVSERTARRDLEALGMAGIPVYSRQGRNGGWQLLGGARTDLSGLTAAEARALFLVAGPSSSATPEVKAALRKLVRALPEPFRSDAEAAQTAVVVDHTAWGARRRDRPIPPHLDALQDAVISGEQVRLDYVARDRSESTRVVHPLGLATKNQTWYLVADTEAGLRTFRVERVRGVVALGEPVVRPEGFDLAEAWNMITDEVDQKANAVHARGLARPEAIGLLRMIFGNRVSIGPAAADGRIEVDISAAHIHALAGELAGVGHQVEVHEPPELRERLGQIGTELAALYPGSAVER